MMSKNLPYWGESAQPGKTYTSWSLIVTSSELITLMAKAVCDELAAGSKSTDHTISFFQHFIDLTGFRSLQYVLTMQESARRGIYLDGRLKLCRVGDLSAFVFSTWHLAIPNSNLTDCSHLLPKHSTTEMVFCIEMLHGVAEHTFHSNDIFQWRAPIENKYAAVHGIPLLRDFRVTRESV